MYLCACKPTWSSSREGEVRDFQISSAGSSLKTGVGPDLLLFQCSPCKTLRGNDCRRPIRGIPCMRILLCWVEHYLGQRMPFLSLSTIVCFKRLFISPSNNPPVFGSSAAFSFACIWQNNEPMRCSSIAPTLPPCCHRREPQHPQYCETTSMTITSLFSVKVHIDFAISPSPFLFRLELY